jgi:DNA (cytosine-5)-methyltransferase 1
MLKTLGDEGYLIEWRVVSASDYGFPQRRIRVFIVAKRTKETPVKIDDYITKDGILARALPVSSSFEGRGEIDLSESPDLISKNFNKGAGKSPFLNAGVYFGGRAYTLKTTAAHKGKKVVLGDVVLPDDQVPSEYFVGPDRIKEWEYLKGAKTIERLHKASGTAYNYAEGKMAFPDLLTNPSRTILTGEGGTSPSRFKHIIKTKKGYRRLTPVELERLNGFPDNWTSIGSDAGPVSDVRRAFFMGNALVVGLIQRVGKVLADEIKSSQRDRK